MRLYVATLWACISLTCMVPLVPSTSKSSTPDFDCRGFAFAVNLEKLEMTATTVPRIRRGDDSNFPVGKDLLNLHEILDDKKGPRAANLDDAAELGGSKSMKCVLLGALLRESFGEEKMVHIVSETEKKDKKLLLPIVFIFDDKDEAVNGERDMLKLDLWKKEKKYNIGIVLKKDKKVKEIKLDEAIIVLPDLFEGKLVSNKQHRVFIHLSKLVKLLGIEKSKPSWLTQLETIGQHVDEAVQGDVADVVLIVCGPEPCQEYLGPEGPAHTSARAQTAAGELDSPRTSDSGTEGTRETTEANSASINCSEVSGAPQECLPETAAVVAMKDDPPAEHRFTIRVQWPLSERIGDEGLLPPEALKKYGGLRCFFFAISSNFGEHEKDCENPEFIKFPKAMLSARFKVLDGNKIVITHDARQPPDDDGLPEVRSIIVHPPIGFTSGTCVIHAKFIGADGATRRSQLKISGDKKHFYLDMSGEDVVVVKKPSSIDLEVRSFQDCRMRSRTVTINPASIEPNNPASFEPKSGVVTIDLRGQQMARRHVVYIPRFNDASYKQGEFSRKSSRGTIGQAMVRAIRIAHLRLAATPQDTLWRLDSAAAVVFSRREKDVLMRLDGLSKLESTTVSGLFSTPLEKSGDNGLNRNLIGQFSESDRVSELHREDMFNAIMKLVATGRLSDTDSGGPSMTLVLLGQMKVYSDAKDNVCDTVALKDDLDWLKKSFREEGVAESVSIVSFPLVVMKQGAVGDLADKVALTQYHSGNPEVLQGVVKCRNQTEDIAIYPLIARNWFDVPATAAWFTTAVGDQLGAVLDELNTGS